MGRAYDPIQGHPRGLHRLAIPFERNDQPSAVLRCRRQSGQELAKPVMPPHLAAEDACADEKAHGHRGTELRGPRKRVVCGNECGGQRLLREHLVIQLWRRRRRGDSLAVQLDRRHVLHGAGIEASARREGVGMTDEKRRESRISANQGFLLFFLSEPFLMNGRYCSDITRQGKATQYAKATGKGRQG